MPGKDTLFERLLVLKKAQIVVQNPPFGRGGTEYRVVRTQGQARVRAAGSWSRLRLPQSRGHGRTALSGTWAFSQTPGRKDHGSPGSQALKKTGHCPGQD